MSPRHLKLSYENGGKVLRIRMNRPEVRNSFNHELIEDFQQVFSAVNAAEHQDLANVRAVILQGEGAAFCGGGDLHWMKRSLSLSHEENLEDCLKLTKMFHTMDQCPVPLIGLVHGFAMGGGVGLVAVCDHVISADDAMFSLSEVRLGLIPACIGPFVIAKVGVSHARSLFISGERFRGEKALKINLVHEICKAGELESQAQKLVTNILDGGPRAIEAAKFLVHSVSRDLVGKEFQKSLDFAAGELARLRVLPEAQEGLSAFLEKRPPSWRK